MLIETGSADEEGGRILVPPVGERRWLVVRLHDVLVLSGWGDKLEVFLAQARHLVSNNTSITRVANIHTNKYNTW